MNKKQLFIKLLAIVVGGVAVFLLSSCLTSLRILSCKRSCVESCNSGSDGDISGNEYGIYYTLSEDGGSYMVSEVGYKETSVAIPETYEGLPVIGIKRYAFEHFKRTGTCGGGYYLYNNLSDLTLPKTIEVLEAGVFATEGDYYYNYGEGARCDDLIFEGTIEDWCGIKFGSLPLYGGTKLYIGGELLTDLVIPETVTKISANSFAYYSKLESLTLHENVTEIGSYAFYGCGLKEITFPCTDLTIGEAAFFGCSQLDKVTFTGENLVLDSSVFAECSVLKEVEWNTVAVKKISAYAFAYCYGLESFVIPASVEDIGSHAFEGCINIDDVYNLSKLHVYAGSETNGKVAYYAGIVHTAEEDNSYIHTEGDYKFVVSNEKTTLFKYTGDGGVLNLPDNLGTDYTIRGGAFENNGTITAVNIPDCVTEIGNFAFYACDNLQLLSGCKGVVSVGLSAFEGCVKLPSVEFESVEEIDNFAFEYCIALKSIKFPKLKKISGKAVFYHCVALEYLTLPISLTEIWQSAFEGCTAEITYEGTLEQWAEVTLSDVALYEVTITCSNGEWKGKI